MHGRTAHKMHREKDIPVSPSAAELIIPVVLEICTTAVTTQFCGTCSGLLTLLLKPLHFFLVFIGFSTYFALTRGDEHSATFIDFFLHDMAQPQDKRNKRDRNEKDDDDPFHCESSLFPACG